MKKKIQSSSKFKLIVLLSLLINQVAGQIIMPGTFNKDKATNSISRLNKSSSGGLTQIYCSTGHYSLSADGAGSNDSSMNIQVNKPTATATVAKAFLLSTSTNGTISDGCITLDASSVNWDGSVTKEDTPGLIFNNYWSDVTTIITSHLSSLGAGEHDIAIEECNSPGIEGSALLVIFNDPGATEKTIIIMWGSQNSDGDNFYVTLAEPLDAALSGTMLDMGLGIGYSCQASGGDQASTINVNGTLMTSSAGGEDDGETANGALITVGGIGDLNANPANPLQMAHDPRTDDELYNILPFITNTTTNLLITSYNESGDDNIFLAYFAMSGAALVGEGILLSQTETTANTGTEHTVKAKVLNSSGVPISNSQVSFSINSGPNSGASFSVSTNANGEAFYTYTGGGGAGTDNIKACYTTSLAVVKCSNILLFEWKALPCINPASAGTIGSYQTGCSPFDPATITSSVNPSGHTGTLEYQWYSSTDSSSFTVIPGATSITYNPPSGLALTTWFKRSARVACKSNWVGAAESNAVKVLINNASAGGSIAGSVAVCSGTNSTTLTLSGYTGHIIKWQRSTDNWTNSNDIANTLATYTATNLTTLTKYRAVVQSGVCSSANSSDAAITVNTVSVGGSLAGSVVVCSGTNSTTLTLSGYTGHIIKWQYSTNNWTNTSDIANTLTTYTATNLTTTTKYRVVVQSGVCSSANSSDAAITVNTVSAGGSLAGSVVVCSGTNSTTLTLSGYTGHIIKWQSSTDNWANTTDIANTLATNSATNLTTLTKYRAVVQSGVCSSANSSDATITVNPASAGGSIAGSVAVCSGTNSATLTLSGYTGHIVKWQSSTDNWTNTTDIANTLATCTATNLTASTTFRAVVQNEICSSANSTNATVIVITRPVTPSISGDTVVSGIGTATYFYRIGNSTNGVTGNEYHWTVPENVTKEAGGGLNDNFIVLSFRSKYGLFGLKVTENTTSPVICSGVTRTLNIAVNPAVDASFTASRKIVCSGTSITFTANPDAISYFWDYGDNSRGYSLRTTSHTYTNFTNSPVIMEAKLITSSGINSTDEKKISITVLPLPMPQFATLPPTQLYKSDGNPVTFINNSAAGDWNCLWRFGDGGVSKVREPVHPYTAPGNFNVTLIVSNTWCTDSISHAVTIVPIQPVAEFDPIPPGCEPLSVKFKNTSLYTEIPGTSYLWNFGDGSISTEKNPDYTFNKSGIFNIELKVTGPGGTSVKSRKVNLFASPEAFFKVTPNIVFSNNEKIRCINLSEGAETYLWEFGDGDTSKIKEPLHRYMEAKIYDITLWAYSLDGCSNKFILSPAVTVESPGEIKFPTAFIPNKGGPVELSGLPTEGTSTDQFFFPMIREKVMNFKLQIFSRLGVLVFESRDINMPWNGYNKGKLCSQGVYVWQTEGKYENGTPFRLVGDVTLLY